MNFSFYTAGEIIFGAGRIEEIGDIAARYGTHVLICLRGEAMNRSGILDRVCAILRRAGLSVDTYAFPPSEPDIEDIDAGAGIVRNLKPDAIVAIGGGSSIDSGKALSGLATHPGSVVDYLEGVGRALPLTMPALPFIAVPTTAGTGSEVTKNAVISSREKKFKKSMRSARLIPTVALLDPELTLSLPPEITATTGMDALTQLIESYISRKAQPLPEALALHGISLAGISLERAVMDGRDLEARERMLLASLESGMALANSGLGAAHGIAAALGAICGIPHGRACAVLLPGVMRRNLSSSVAKFERIARALTGRNSAGAEDAIRFIIDLCARIGIPAKFSAGEVSPASLDELVAGSRGSSMNGNPVQLSDGEIERLIRDVLPGEKSGLR